MVCWQLPPSTSGRCGQCYRRHCHLHNPGLARQAHHRGARHVLRCASPASSLRLLIHFFDCSAAAPPVLLFHVPCFSSTDRRPGWLTILTAPRAMPSVELDSVAHLGPGAVPGRSRRAAADHVRRRLLTSVHSLLSLHPHIHKPHTHARTHTHAHIHTHLPVIHHSLCMADPSNRDVAPMRQG